MDSRDRSSGHGPARAPQRVAQAFGCGVLQTYLPHYVDLSGELLREPMGVRDMARFLTDIVSAGTAAAKSTRQSAACRTLNVKCPGLLETRIEAAAQRIVWQCPVCGLSGSIAGWEGTRWDRRSAPRAPVERVNATARTKRKRRDVELA